MSEPYYQDEQVTLWHGDALVVLREMPNQSVDCCVTSPPYFGLRDYDVPSSAWPEVTYAPMMGMPTITVPEMTCVLGDEPDPASFVAHLRLIFAEVRRVLKADGTLWLNIGDSYYSGRGNPGPNASDPKQAARRGFVRAVDRPGQKWGRAKSQLMIPARTALALEEEGWINRRGIVWAKPNPMPEAVSDRPTASHENVFLFTRSKSYFYDGNAIAETATGQASGNGFQRPEQINRGGVGSEKGWEGRPQLRRALELAREKGLTEAHFAAIRSVGMNDAGKARVNQSGTGKNSPEVQMLADEAKSALGGYYREFLTGGTKNARDVWTIPVVGFPEAHFACMTPELAERAILAGCKPGGTVLDPFSGSGTTGLAAAKHGRKYVGIDLNRDYLDLSLRTRLAQTALLDDGGAA